MIRLLSCSIVIMMLLAGCHLNSATENTVKKECVIVIHGLGKSAFSMRKIARALNEEGYTVWNGSYPSTREPIETLADNYIAAGLQHCNHHHAKRIHFVTHSMGAILFRDYQQRHPVKNIGRVVMLAPPNHGSEIVDRLGHWPLYQRLLGPAGSSLTTGDSDLPHRLGATSADVGIIAARLSIEPWFSILLPGPDDGKVSIASTQLDGMNDFVTAPTTHGLIVHHRSSIQQTQRFLRTGHFSQHHTVGANVFPSQD